MKRGLELIIGRDGGEVCWGGAEARAELGADADVGAAVERFCRKQGIKTRVVTLYAAEDTVFHCGFDLPASVPDLRQAVEMQLGMLTPFAAADSCYAFTRRRERDLVRIRAVSCARDPVERVIVSLKAAGFAVRGLYPESQRYLSPRSPAGSWTLVFAGRVHRIAVFRDRRFAEMILSDSSLDPERIKELAGVDEVVAAAGAGAAGILAAPPLPGRFNMLPREYRSTDIEGIAVKVLAACAGLVLLVAVAGGFYRLRAVSRDLDARIAALAPAVSKARDESRKQRELREFVDAYVGIGPNPDIFRVLASLTRVMPEHSYLEQLQYEAGVYRLRGFTGDVGELTAALEKEFGNARLKSTSRRRGKLYFQIELEAGQ